MKGIVFRELIDLIEEQFSVETADRIICSSGITSAGAYTSVGTYDHREIVTLVAHLSDATGVAMPDLLRMFGKHMFKRFSALYPSHFDGHSTAFAFLSTLDSKIHVEVKKLYPDAELPAFAHDLSSPGRMILVYRSKRPFADLAEGLLQGCIDHFKEPVHVAREDLPCTDGAHTRFTLTR